MAEILLFGGTTEGRELAELLETLKKSTLVCVATTYGEQLLTETENVRVHMGRLDIAEMQALFEAEKPRIVLDATHPYAVVVSENIRVACENAGVRYLRVVRESAQTDENVRWFETMEDLISWLNTREEVVFSSMGAKEAAPLSQVKDFETRVWVRVLPLMDSLQKCLDAGYPPKHIICMQGPFSQEVNEAMFRASGAGILVTKESGKAGGFEEKLSAAAACGMETAVLGRPKVESGMTMGEMTKKLCEDSL